MVEMPPVSVRYREYAPCEALRGRVRALFSFSEPVEEPSRRSVLLDVRFGGGEWFCAPTFADAHPCIVFNFENCYCPDGVWRHRSIFPRGDVIGPMTFPGPPSVPARSESIGVYFCAGAAIPGTPAVELENRVVALEEIWGTEARHLADELISLRGEAARLNRLESALVQRMEALGRKQTAVDISGMAGWIVRSGGQLAVEKLAEAAGLSRRHLTRVFRENVGVSPKIYCQLARFRSALCYARRGENVGWAHVAVDCGYADQSHMIAEFRRFAGLTPEALVQGRWFHPFIEAGRLHRDRSSQKLPLDDCL
jgi:AraC-like DNA-binding protein